MSQAVVEAVFIPLVAGLDITTGDGKKLIDETLSTIKSQPGCSAIYYGRQLEHPDVLQFLIGKSASPRRWSGRISTNSHGAIEWESLQHHKDFQERPIYGPFVEKLTPALAGEVSIHHLEIQTKAPQDFTAAASAPVTECITLYFEPSHPNEAFQSNYDQFVELGLKLGKEVKGIAGGWSVEEHKHANLGAKEGEEGPAKVFGSFVGWPSVQAHMEFRSAEFFPEIVSKVRDGPKGRTVHHVAFQKF